MDRPLEQPEDVRADGEAAGVSEFERLLEELVERFEDAWQRGTPPAIEEHVPRPGPLHHRALVELAHTDLEYRWKRGEPVRVEGYLERFPQLEEDREAVLELIAAESRLRRRAGESSSREEYLLRFPAYRDELFSLEALDDPPSEERSPLRRAGLQGSADAVQAAALSPPARLGKFEIRGILGTGSYGTVYRARDTELDRDVALKIPHAVGPRSREMLERFLREARSAARLRHPGIVAVYDAGRIDATYYLASELVPGTTLQARLAQGRLAFRQGAELVARVAEALSAAHESGVIHRDVKPSNIIVDPEGRPHVTDFGLARRDAGDATLTATDEVLGTPAYMPPEQARGERADARSDVYSLGVVFYELLTGARPFRGSSRMVLKQVLEEEPRPPRRLDESIPRDLETICLEAMAKEPSGRYTTAEELGRDLRRFLRGEPVRARPITAPARVWRWARRRPALASLAAGCLVAVILGVTGVTWQWRRAERHLDEARRQRFAAERRIEQTFRSMADWSRTMQETMPGLERFRKDIAQDLLDEYLQGLERASEEGTEGWLARLRPGPPYAILQAATLGMDPGPALEVSRRALSCWGESFRREPQAHVLKESLALTHYRVGALEKAAGERKNALRHFEEAQEILGACVKEVPDDARLRFYLSRTSLLVLEELARRGRVEDVLEAFARWSEEDAVEPFPEDPVYLGFARIAGGAADALVEEAVLRAVEKALGIRRDSREAWFRPVAAAARLSYGLFESEMYEEALEVLEEAVPHAEEARRRYPGDLDIGHELARLLKYQSETRLALSGHPAGLAALERAREVLAEACREAPEDERIRRFLSKVINSVAGYYYNSGRLEEAAAAYRESLAGIERVLSETPADTTWHLLRGQCLNALALVNRERGDLEGALVLNRQSVAVWEELLLGGERRARGTLRTIYHGIGNILLDLERPAEAVTAFERALAFAEELCREEPRGRLNCYQAESARRRLEEAREKADAVSPAAARKDAPAALRDALGAK